MQLLNGVVAMPVCIPTACSVASGSSKTRGCGSKHEITKATEAGVGTGKMKQGIVMV